MLVSLCFMSKVFVVSYLARTHLNTRLYNRLRERDKEKFGGVLKEGVAVLRDLDTYIT